ncbi:hypothetical protein ARAM_005466 [Aspergillus rambellii]|uniref:Transcription factor TFIIIC complex subunit Tfc6 n=1 Tax=Aspergillus rambellii TaxID=308745 RepID=A0A0F8UJZ0_9EURO|nr:hypothetical protein ARAM_005466 [Aspergillus rambellii]
MPRARRSNRLSGAPKKYVEDPFASEESESNSVEETGALSRNKGKQPVHQESSDEEFQAPPGENEDEEEEAEEGGEEEEEEEDGDEDDEGVAPEIEDEEDGDGQGGGGGPLQRRKKALTFSQPRYNKKRHADGTIALSGEEMHSRGTWNPTEHVAKSVHLQVVFGIDDRDLLAILYSRSRWHRGLDSGFPSRASLNEAQKLPDYTYGATFGLEPEDLKRESTRGWDWYYGHGAGERFGKRQRIERIKEKEARQIYMPTPKQGKHTVLVGPANDQRAYTIGQNESFDFGDAWTGASQQKNQKETGKVSATKKKKRQGWIINVGNRIQCMAWAPNHNGLNQYLAIVAPISKEQKEMYPDPLKDHAAPAFRASAPYPCALQLWAFKAEKGESLTRTIDMSFKPRLRLALCTNWGDLRRMAWCPMTREPRDEDEEDTLRNVGLLAGVWGDGYVRVIDVKSSRDPNETDFYRVDSPVFEAKPPSTVCTCVAWLSPSDIAVGCANGFIAVWSIASGVVQAVPQASQINALPYFYEPVHSTYVLSVSSAYPTHPLLVGSTSMDGETRLSSLLDYQKDTVETTRMRVGSPHLSYSPWLQSFISSDENDFVRLLTVRRFFTTTAVARLPSTVSTLASCSSWHPTLLLGCTGGAVIATNPLRRLLHAKEKQWQQTWFSHTWTRGDDSSGSGTSRFHDGYRAESIRLLRNMIGDRKLINGTMVITIFEEETHVTALAWNPNQSYAGWAGAGVGCGLVRVEDVAI